MSVLLLLQCEYIFYKHFEKLNVESLQLTNFYTTVISSNVLCVFSLFCTRSEVK